MGKKVKLSGNSYKDYMTGKEHGKSEGVKLGFLTATYLALAAYDNTRDEELVCDEEFGRWATKAEKELNRLFHEEFKGDFDTAVKAVLTPQQQTQESIEDNVHYGFTKLNQLRKRLGMEEL